MRYFIFLIVLVLLVWGFPLIVWDAELSETAVANFHRQLNSRNYDGIYAMSTEGFKESGTKGNLTAFLGGVRAKLGRNKNSTLQGWGIYRNFFSLVTEVSLEYKSQYQGGEAFEKFVFHESFGRSLLHSYDAQKIK